MKNKLSLVIVIPTYNERDNVGILVKNIFNVSKDIKVLFVDDNSPDDTGKMLDLIAKKHKHNVFVIHRKDSKNKRSLGRSYVDGFLYAIKNFKADYFMSMDADLSHNPIDISRFLKKIRECDVVVGSRYIKGGGVCFDLKRRVMSKGANWLAIKALRLPVHDVTSGYRCYRRKVLESVDLKNMKSDGYAFFQELLFKASQKNFIIKEIPIFFSERRKGESKLGKKEILEFFTNLLRLKSGF